MAQLENIKAIEKRLRGSPDKLRANSNYASHEYDCYKIVYRHQR